MLCITIVDIWTIMGGLELLKMSPFIIKYIFCNIFHLLLLIHHMEPQMQAWKNEGKTRQIMGYQWLCDVYLWYHLLPIMCFVGKTWEILAHFATTPVFSDVNVWVSVAEGLNQSELSILKDKWSLCEKIRDWSIQYQIPDISLWSHIFNRSSHNPCVTECQYNLPFTVFYPLSLIS